MSSIGVAQQSVVGNPNLIHPGVDFLVSIMANVQGMNMRTSFIMSWDVERYHLENVHEEVIIAEK